MCVREREESEEEREGEGEREREREGRREIERVREIYISCDHFKATIYCTVNIKH